MRSSKTSRVRIPNKMRKTRRDSSVNMAKWVGGNGEIIGKGERDYGIEDKGRG